MEHISIDRIVGSTAVCEKEDMSIVELPLSSLPKGVKEGSVLAFENGVYSVDKAEEEKRREKIMNLQNLLFGDD